MERTAVLRAQWLAQISETIESAQRLAWQLRTDELRSGEARQLYGMLEAARVEVDSLCGLEARRPNEVEPRWLQLLGWDSSPADLPD